MIDFDVETTGIQWYAHDLFLVTFLDDNDAVEVLHHPADAKRIQWWLDQDDDFRAWNTKFDLHFLQASGYRLPPEERWHDGMVQAHIINEQRSHALKAVGAEMFGEAERETEQAVKDWLGEETKRRRAEVKKSGEALVRPTYQDVPFEIMEPYAKQDVFLTRKVCVAQDRVLAASPALAGVYEKERAVLAALYRAEERGVPVDREAALALYEDLCERMEELHQECVDLAGIETFNPGSSAQIAEALKRRGADLGKAGRTSKGAMSMDVTSLGRIDDDLCRAVLRFRSEMKVLGTYIKPMLFATDDGPIPKAPFIVPGPDGSWRIHTNLRQVGARTGRMSSSDPNMQNWPRDDLRLRYLIAADPGMKLVTADLSSIEMVVFAAFLGEGKLYDAICDPDLDPHIMAADMVGLTDYVRPGGHVEPKRQRGKTFNFSVLYGAGINSITTHFGVSDMEARRMLDAYHRAFPEIGALQRKVRYALEDRGYVKTPWGRRHRIPKQQAYKGVNAIVQGTAADMLKDAVIACHADGLPLVNCVHDELIFHAPEDEAEEMLERVVAHMTRHPDLGGLVEIGAEGVVVDRWSDAKKPGWVPDFTHGEVEAA